MLRTLLQIDIDTLITSGFDIQILKDCIVIKNGDKSFINTNTAILLIKSGGLRIRLREVCLELSAQDLVILTKGLIVAILEADPKLKLFYFSFTKAYAMKNCNSKALIDAFYLSSGQNIEKVQLDSKSFFLVSIIYKLMYHSTRDNDSQSKDSELRRVGFDLFLYKLRSIYGEFTNDYHLNFTRNENVVIQFLNLMDIHLKEQHSVQFYASALHVTSGHLNTIVKQILGKTVKIILEERLVKEAKKALEDSQITITSISAELGFNCAFNFSAFFKKYAGISPTAYRSSLS
jgi:AraC family transcriptional activator of pobA